MDAAWHSDLAEIYFMVTFIISAVWKNMRTLCLKGHTYKMILHTTVIREKMQQIPSHIIFLQNFIPWQTKKKKEEVEKKKTLLALLSADMSWRVEIHLGLHCTIKVQRLSFCPWTKCPRWAACAEYILLPAGHKCIQQDSSASSPSSTWPVKHQVRLDYTAIYSLNQSVFSAIIRK